MSEEGLVNSDTSSGTRDGGRGELAQAKWEDLEVPSRFTEQLMKLFSYCCGTNKRFEACLPAEGATEMRCLFTARRQDEVSRF